MVLSISTYRNHTPATIIGALLLTALTGHSFCIVGRSGEQLVVRRLLRPTLRLAVDRCRFRVHSHRGTAQLVSVTDGDRSADIAEYIQVSSRRAYRTADRLTAALLFAQLGTVRPPGA